MAATLLSVFLVWSHHRVNLLQRLSTVLSFFVCIVLMFWAASGEKEEVLRGLKPLIVFSTDHSKGGSSVENAVLFCYIFFVAFVLSLFCSSSLLLLVPLEGCASWLWYFLSIFTYFLCVSCLLVALRSYSVVSVSLCLRMVRFIYCRQYLNLACDSGFVCYLWSLMSVRSGAFFVFWFHFYPVCRLIIMFGTSFPLRKHAYINILKISHQKLKVFR